MPIIIRSRTGESGSGVLERDQCLQEDQGAARQRTRLLLRRRSAVHHWLHSPGHRLEQDHQGYGHPVQADAEAQCDATSPAMTCTACPSRSRSSSPSGSRARRTSRPTASTSSSPPARTSPWASRSKMTEQFKELGVWMDWEKPYMTIAPSYIEAAWWTLKRAHDKGLLVTANRVISWCPRCETALAEAEIEYCGREGPVHLRQVPPEGRERGLPADLDHHPLDAAGQHGGGRPSRLPLRQGPVSPQGRERTPSSSWRSLIDQIGELEGWEEYDILELIEGDDLVGKEYVPPFGEEVDSQREMRRQVGPQGHPLQDGRGGQDRPGAHRSWPRSGGLRAGQGVRHRAVLPGGRERQVHQGRRDADTRACTSRRPTPRSSRTSRRRA